MNRKLLVKIPILGGKIVREEEIGMFLEVLGRGGARSRAEGLVQEVLRMCYEVGEKGSGDLIRVFLGKNGVEFEVCWAVRLGEKVLDEGVNFDFGFRKGVEGELFVVREGQLLVKNGERLSVLSYFLQKYAEEMLVVLEVEDFGEFFKDDEIMIIDDWHGVVSVRKIGEVVLGNSRFWARKLREVVRSSWVR